MLYVHLHMQITAQLIAELIGGEIVGNGEEVISGPATIENAGPGHITFLGNPKYESFIYQTNASVVLVDKNFVPKEPLDKVLIKVKDVYAALSTLVAKFSNSMSIAPIVSSLASVHPSVTLGEHVSIDDFSIIKPNVKIGNSVKIYGQVFIGDGVTIGNNTVIYPGVKIYHNCSIGDHCIIHSNVVIGSDGFGFVKTENGVYNKIEHVGSVVVEDNVEIGANTVIDRAVMAQTIIRKGAKLDNLIQIAHNVEIGQNTVIAAQTGIAGSSKIGDSCVVGGQVGVAGHVKIADEVMIQAQSGISSTIEKKGSKWYGSPALDYTNYLKSYAYFKQLPEWAKQIKILKDTLSSLNNKVDL